MNRFTEKIKSNKAALLICFVLAAMIWAVFGQTRGHEFLNYDDPGYVQKNPNISQGLTLTRLKQARAITYDWNPVTTLSYRSDYKLFGLNPSGYHLMNVLLHMATSITLFLVLRSMTGSLWRSAVVAMLFAIHPLRAESVAWVSGRKDVLSGLFFMLSLGAYARYVKRVTGDGLPRCSGFGAPWLRMAGGSYMMVVIFFTLGLMSKAMLVTMPFVLLLLDFWPLQRFSPIAAGSRDGAQALFRLIQRLIMEKIPLLLVSAVFCGITVWAEQGTIVSGEQLSFPWRAGNSICSYVTYIRQTLFPTGLAAFYPHPGTSLPLWQITASLILLIMISLAVLILWRKRPYLMTGWLWYVGMLVPVIGLTQIGQHAHADRFTYLPQIGLYILLVWLVAEASVKWPHRRLIVGTAVTVLLAVLMAGAWIQTSHWRNDQSLWEHALAHTTENAKAHNNLGNVLLRQGKIEAAIEHFQQALQINPGSEGIRDNLVSAHNDLGIALARQGKLEAAIEHFQQALRINPNSADAQNNLASAHNDLGIALAKQGKLEAAIEHFQQALRINPNSADAQNNLASAHNDLGIALARQGKLEAAIEHFQQALRINPNSVDAQNNLGMATMLLMQGR